MEVISFLKVHLVITSAVLQFGPIFTNEDFFFYTSPLFLFLSLNLSWYNIAWFSTTSDFWREVRNRMAWRQLDQLKSKTNLLYGRSKEYRLQEGKKPWKGSYCLTCISDYTQEIDSVQVEAGTLGLPAWKSVLVHRPKLTAWTFSSNCPGNPLLRWLFFVCFLFPHPNKKMLKWRERGEATLQQCFCWWIC